MINTVKKGAETMTKITKIEPMLQENSTLKVAAYARVSTGSSDQIASLEAQKRHYERFIKSHKEWEYAGIYYDEAVSGLGKEKRDGLIRMLKDCNDGLIDFIIVKSISRFSRNTVDCIEIVRKLCSQGIYMYFEKERINTKEMESELLLSILSGLAENESRSISQNVKWGIRKRMENGKFIISYPPYGYSNINGEMKIVPDEAEVVKWIFDRILSGNSAYHVATMLNEMNITSKRNGRWHSESIIGIIKNEKYTGDVLFQKTFTDDMFQRHINNGERDMYLAKNHHEAIISHDTFEKANDVIRRNAKEKGIESGTKKYLARYPFSGKIICNECGHTFKRVKRESSYSYSCTGHLKNKNDCMMKPIKEEVIKTAFCNMLNKLIFSRDKLLVPCFLSLKNQDSEGRALRLGELEEKIEDNIEKMQRVERLFYKGYIDNHVYDDEISHLKKEEMRLEKERVALDKIVTSKSNNLIALADIVEYTKHADFLKIFDGELFNRFVEKIIVYSVNEIGFKMKFGSIFKEAVV